MAPPRSSSEPRSARAGSAIATGSFGDRSLRIPTIATIALDSTPHTSEVVGAVRMAIARAGVGANDINLIELADNTAWHVLAWPEFFGFLEPGQADWMLAHGELAISGKLPVNPSGGFLFFRGGTTGQGGLPA